MTMMRAEDRHDFNTILGAIAKAVSILMRDPTITGAFGFHFKMGAQYIAHLIDSGRDGISRKLNQRSRAVEELPAVATR